MLCLQTSKQVQLVHLDCWRSHIKSKFMGFILGLNLMPGTLQHQRVASENKPTQLLNTSVPPVLMLNDPVCKHNSHCNSKNIFCCNIFAGPYYQASLFIRGLVFFIHMEQKPARFHNTKKWLTFTFQRECLAWHRERGEKQWEEWELLKTGTATASELPSTSGALQFVRVWSGLPADPVSVQRGAVDNSRVFVL